MSSFNQPSLIELAQKEYFKAEKANKSSDRATHYLKSARLFIQAAENNLLDDNTKASLIYLATIAGNKASSNNNSNSNHRLRADSLTNDPKDYDLDVALVDGRTITYSTLRTKISGIRKIPKANPSKSSTIINDLLLLENKLAAIGISKNSNHRLTNNSTMASNVSTSLGESFMILNNHQNQSKLMYQSFRNNNNANNNDRRIDIKNNETNKNTKTNLSTSPSNPTWWGILGFTENQTTNQSTNLSPYNENKVSNQITSRASNKPIGRSNNQVNEAINWNEQSIMFNNHDNTGGMDKTVMEQICRLQQTIKTLGEENNEMLEKLNAVNHQIEQNKLAKQEIEAFKTEYTERFGNLRKSLSDFVLRYPGSENPANNFIVEAIDKPIDKSDTNESEAKLQKLLVLINQKDNKIKKYEEYYKKLKARNNEKRSNSLNSNDNTTNEQSLNSLPIDSIRTNTPSSISPTSTITRSNNIVRHTTVKHPSTSTLESSIHRNQTKYT